MESYIKTGKLVSAHGLTGELVLQHELGKRSDLRSLKALFVEVKKGSFLPYFITRAKATANNEVLVLLEGIADREQAQQLVGKYCWLPQEQFTKLAAPSAPATLLGYRILEEDKELGTIEEVIEQPQQLLCKIIMQQKEVLIPLHESSLLSIDHDDKIVYVQLPEGLLDIYLS